MKITELHEITVRTLNMYTVAAACIWSLLYASFEVHDYFRERDRSRASALVEARALIQRDRTWISAICGRVYSPVSPDLHGRNPVSLPDSTTASHGILSRRATSVLLRETMSSLVGSSSQATVHFSSAASQGELADKWQEDAWREIREGRAEMAEEFPSPGGTVFRVMAPVTADSSCVSCHVQWKGAKGNVAGALTASVPMKEFLSIGEEHMVGDAMRFSAVWLGGLLALFVMRSRAGARLNERRRIEAALHDANERYERIVSNEHVGIWEIDERAQTSFVNRRMAAMLGYSIDEMLGRPLYDFMGEEERPHAGRNFERRMQRMEEQHEVRFRRKDGRPLWALVSTQVILDAQGSFKGELVIISDISGRKRAEDDLKRSEELLRTLVESTDDVITMQDLEGRYLYFNGPASRYGVTADQVVRRTPEELFDPQTAEVIMTQIRKVKVEAEPLESEFKIPWRGEELWMQSRLYPVCDASGQVVGVSTFSRNITEQKKAQQELRQAQERLKTENLRARIAADLHDDLGSTLSSTSIFAAMLRRNLTTGTGHPEELLARVEKNLSEVQESLHDIVWSINPENDNLENIVLKMQDHAREVMDAQQITLRLDLPDVRASQQVPMAGRRLMYLVFKEAVNNVVRHSRCTEATLSVTITKEVVKITISDNGIGFDPEHTPRGNGLSNMRRRAQTIGGTLQLRSARGLGTTVSLRVPIA